MLNQIKLSIILSCLLQLNYLQATTLLEDEYKAEMYKQGVFDRNGFTVLQAAVMGYSTDRFALLQAFDQYDFFQGDLALVRQMLADGADVTEVNSNRKTALDLLMQNFDKAYYLKNDVMHVASASPKQLSNNRAIADLLISHIVTKGDLVADLKYALMSAVRVSSKLAVTFLLEKYQLYAIVITEELVKEINDLRTADHESSEGQDVWDLILTAYEDEQGDSSSDDSANQLFDSID